MATTMTQPLGWGLLPLLLLAVLITITLQMSFEGEAPEKSEPPAYADYFIRGAKMSSLGPNGKLLYQVRAEELLHFPDSSAVLTDMHMHYEGGPMGVWSLKAAKGHMPPGGKEVKLIGDVIIRGRREGQGLTRMQMSEVVFLLEEGMMTTTKPVIITKPDAKITAVGMRADIVKDVISLSEDVQVRYAW